MPATPGTRRSSRLQARSRSQTPAPSPSTATTDPLDSNSLASLPAPASRRGRSQRGSLPPIAVSTSSAYGSDSRITVDTTLRATGGSNPFVSHFEKHRQTAASRDGHNIPATIEEEPGRLGPSQSRPFGKSAEPQNPDPQPPTLPKQPIRQGPLPPLRIPRPLGQSAPPMQPQPQPLPQQTQPAQPQDRPDGPTHPLYSLPEYVRAPVHIKAQMRRQYEQRLRIEKERANLEKQQRPASPNESTLAHISKSFGGTHEGGIVTSGPSWPRPPPMFRSQPRSRFRVSSPLAWCRVSWRTFSRSWLEICTAVFCVLMTITAALLFTIVLAAARGRSLGTAGAHQDLGPWNNFATAVSTSMGLTADLPSELMDRISSVQKNVDQVQQSSILHEETIRRLEEELPDFIVVRKNKETGEPELSDFFWRALESRIFALRDDIQTGKKDLVWEEFWQNNRDRFRQLVIAETSDQADAAVHRVLDGNNTGDDDNYQYITRAQFTELLRKNVDAQAREIEIRILARVDDALRSASAVAHRIATNQMKQVPLDQLDAIAQTNLARNLEITLKTVNHFSAYAGAAVDVSMTSPTYERAKTWAQKAYRYMFDPAARPLTPSAVLQKWDEPGDCWCSAPSENEKGKYRSGAFTPDSSWIGLGKAKGKGKGKGGKTEDKDNSALFYSGKAQLGVLMPYHIFPDRLTVEHVPKQGTLDPASAPKWVELWVHVENDATRSAVRRSMRNLLRVNDPNAVIDYTNLRDADGVVVDDDGNVIADYDHYNDDEGDSRSYSGDIPRNPEAARDPPVGPGYVCVGRWVYNVHAVNHIQTFDIEVDLKRMGVEVRKAVVRVTENWGQEWTCLYRLRLHGNVVERVGGHVDDF